MKPASTTSQGFPACSGTAPASQTMPTSSHHSHFRLTQHRHQHQPCQPTPPPRQPPPLLFRIQCQPPASPAVSRLQCPQPMTVRAQLCSVGSNPTKSPFQDCSINRSFSGPPDSSQNNYLSCCCCSQTRSITPRRGARWCSGRVHASNL